jgi:hypothetical protein
MSILRETAGGNRSHIAQSEDANLQPVLLSFKQLSFFDKCQVSIHRTQALKSTINWKDNEPIPES